MKYFSTFTGIGGFELGINKAYESNNEHASISKESEQEERQQGGKRSINLDGVQLHDRDRTTPLCVGYSEINKYAVEIYQKHFPEHTNYGDITKINEKELPDFDLLVGGFPCQAFSTARITESHKTGSASSLSDILEVRPDRRYFLSKRMTSGIVRSMFRSRKPLEVYGICQTLKVGGDPPCILGD